MKKLTRVIAPALAAGMAMMAAAPAQANYYDDPREIRSELRQFERQLDRVADRGRLSERNATWLSYRLLGVEQQFQRFSRRGFNDWEISTLNHSLEILHTELDRRARQGNRGTVRQTRGYNGGYDRDDNRGYDSRTERRDDYRSDRRSRDDRGNRQGYRRDD